MVLPILVLKVREKYGDLHVFGNPLLPPSFAAGNGILNKYSQGHQRKKITPLKENLSLFHHLALPLIATGVILDLRCGFRLRTRVDVFRFIYVTPPRPSLLLIATPLIIQAPCP